MRSSNKWILVDREQRALPCRISDLAGWTMLAVSGGRPVDIVLSSEGSHVRPLSVFCDGVFTSLVAIDAGVAA